MSRRAALLALAGVLGAMVVHNVAFWRGSERREEGRVCCTEVPTCGAGSTQVTECGSEPDRCYQQRRCCSTILCKTDPEEKATAPPRGDALNRLPMPSMPADPSQRTIFVSIAAFRDTECAQTVRDLFATAKHPGRIHAGVVCQRVPGKDDEKCVAPEYLNSTQFKVTLHDAAASDAKGPTWARYLAAQMYSGEDYFFMMDSHNKFADAWDENVISQHDTCDSPSGKCVLTVYPMGLDSHGRAGQWTPHLCRNAHWTRAWPGPFLATVKAPTGAPRPQPFLGAGFVFGAGHMVREVPFDPHLPYVFHGEEITLAARLWTHGYDLYSPMTNVLFHHYGREGRPAMRGHAPGKEDVLESSYRRIQYLLQTPDPARPAVTEEAARADPKAWEDIEKYGMGTVRTVAQYWAFSRLDVKGRTHEATEKYWCTTYGGRAPFSDEWKRDAGYKGFD